MAEALDAMNNGLNPDTVHDRESFFAFVGALAADRRSSVAAEKIEPSSPCGPDAGGWENVSIESFLEAALTWAESTSMGVSQGMAPELRGEHLQLSCIVEKSMNDSDVAWNQV